MLYSLSMTLVGILPYIEAILCVFLIGSVLLQQTGASLGGAFGGDNFSAAYHTRRGSEKWLFWTTIILGVLFLICAFVMLLITK